MHPAQRGSPLRGEGWPSPGLPTPGRGLLSEKEACVEVIRRGELQRQEGVVPSAGQGHRGLPSPSGHSYVMRCGTAMWDRRFS